jgi:drug/metabolite transporter (DMT)-like permease
MFIYVFSIVIIVTSNVMYNISQKLTPAKANPFLALLVTYLTAAGLTFILYLFNTDGKGMAESVRELNWSSILLAVSIIGLEYGYLLAYRAGWKISLGSLVANISLALILIPIGVIFFKEGFNISKLLGALLCICGLVLINK